MSATANTRWTVIPRGLKGNQFTFAVAVTPVPTDLGAQLPAPTDVDPWKDWLKYCGDVWANPKSPTSPATTAHLSVIVGQNATVSIPLPFLRSIPDTPSFSDADLNLLWPKLLSYVNADWAATGSKAANDGTSLHLADAQDATVRTSSTQDLRQHMDQIHGASVLAAKRRRPGQSSDAQSLAETQALASIVNNLLVGRLGDLSYLAPSSKPGVGTQAVAANSFRKWLNGELTSGDGTRKLNARAAERNLYRLSDNPYNTLDDDVFGIVMQLAGSGVAKEGPILTDSQAKADERKALVEHAIFHHRYKAKPFGKKAPKKMDTDCPVAVTPATINDFYRTLGLLSHYKEILPYLGLAYTFSVKVDGTGINGRQPFRVAFQPPAGLLRPEANPAYTICDKTGFPASTDPVAQLDGFAILNGMLVLDRCKVETRDIDGETLRTIQNAHTVRKKATTIASVTPSAAKDANPADPPSNVNIDESHTVPSRSAGAVLLHKDAPTHTRSKLKQAFNLRKSQADAQNAGVPPVQLELTDIVRGYTVEVLVGKEWISLTSRDVTYTLNPDANASKPQTFSQPHFPIEPAAATTKDSVTPPPTGTQPGLHDLHQGQAIVRWTGWGLAVDSPFPLPQGKVKSPCTRLPILATYAPPAKKEDRWPFLRYQDGYQFRLRAMDLLCDPISSGSTSPVPAPQAHTTIGFNYRRSDPVHGPTMLFQLVDSGLFVPKTLEDCFPKRLPGETMACLVLRDGESLPHSRRVLVPPVMALDQLLPHREMYDGDDLKDRDKYGSFDDVKIFEDGNFPVVTDNGADCFPYTGAKTIVPIYDKGTDVSSRTYLPDPMAQFLAVEMIDLSDQQALYQGGFDLGDFYPKDSDGNERRWPNATRLAMQVQQERIRGNLTAVWQWDTQAKVMTLMVGVPPGWQARVLLKCVPSLDNAKNIFDFPQAVAGSGTQVASWLDQMATPPGKQSQFGADGKTTLEAQVGSSVDLANSLSQGALDQVTPATEILVIHAVKTPLFPCAIDHAEGSTGVKVHQTYDSAKALLTLTANIGDRRSTGKAELIAVWTDLVDSPPAEYNKAFQRDVHVYQWPLSLQGYDPTAVKDQQKFTNIAQTFPDTSYRLVNLSVNAISRFENLYPAPKSGIDPAFTRLGDPKDTVQVTLLNTSRLDPLRVNRIIPLRPRFKEELPGEIVRVTHYGGAQRIYLERPMQGIAVKDGGQGERLGITLWGENFPVGKACYDNAACFAPADYQSYWENVALEPYVTRWGADPGLCTGALPSLAPLSEQFLHPCTSKEGPRKADVARCAFPAELLLPNDTQPKLCDPNQSPYFTVAHYPVEYDADQQLWYADVQLSMAPAGFIRFALTRYQPQSLINREISRVTVAPLTPIPPQREFYFKKENDEYTKLQIRGTQLATNATGFSRYFEVELLHRKRSLTSSLVDEWEKVPEANPQSISMKAIYVDSQYPVLGTYQLHTSVSGLKLLRQDFMVVVREWETLFADTPGNPGLRKTEARLVDTFIEMVP